MGFELPFHSESRQCNIVHDLPFITHILQYSSQDLLNFDDPLNRDAADLFIKNEESFRRKVKDYVMQYAKR